MRTRIIFTQIYGKRLKTVDHNNKMRLRENKSKILFFKKSSFLQYKKLLASRLIKKILEYKFVITSRGIETQEHEPPNLLKHFISQEKSSAQNSAWN